jgi:predicted MarR family transcription regulator
LTSQYLQTLKKLFTKTLLTRIIINVKGGKEKPSTLSSKESIMTMTYAQAIATLRAEAEAAGFNDAEALAKIDALQASLTRKSERKTVSSKTLANAKRAERILAILRQAETPMTGADIAKALGDEVPPRSVAQLVRRFVESGDIAKGKDGKTVTYEATK